MTLPYLHTLEAVSDHLNMKRNTLLAFCRKLGIQLIAARPTFLLTDADVAAIIEARRTKWHSSSSPQTVTNTKCTTSAARSRKGDAFSKARELRDAAKRS